ncbi:small GTP-binding protein [Tritrichomonas foetus]|uniref:Small GTP-binding protein n=1 Tax=Tritrichomonas foetus TaxID=1144522 RepID=A0A1J4JGN9_9EUKA|nr:small GTP-binding protein [Tritrichomonas foetus]|eukprot:OHS96396.1 small GTP-binding protein [Tritrichomonas foetus]
MFQEEEEQEIKIVLLGQTSVGKTCIVNYFINGQYDSSVAPTLGASYASKTFKVGDVQVSMQIWDTAGQERFRVLAPMYYRGAQVAIIVYSIVDESSFTEIDYWTNSLKENTEGNVTIFLVGNKADLQEIRMILEESGQNKAESLKAMFFETSAVTGNGIDDLFMVCAKKCLEIRNKMQESADSPSVRRNPPTVNVDAPSKKKACC